MNLSNDNIHFFECHAIKNICYGFFPQFSKVQFTLLKGFIYQIISIENNFCQPIYPRDHPMTSLRLVAILYETSASFINFINMTTSVRFCLSYNRLKRDFKTSMGKRIIDTNVVNDVLHTRQSVITRVVIRFS